MKTGLIVTLTILLLLCLGLLSAQPRSSTAPVPAPAEEPEDIRGLRRLNDFFAAWNAGDTGRMAALCVQDADGRVRERITALTEGLVPMEYTVNLAVPSADGEEQVFSVTLTLRRENGGDPVKIDLQAVMRRADGEWRLWADSLAPLAAR